MCHQSSELQLHIWIRLQSIEVNKLSNEGNSIVCNERTPLLSDVFNETLRKENPLTFPSLDCKQAIWKCKECFSINRCGGEILSLLAQTFMAEQLFCLNHFHICEILVAATSNTAPLPLTLLKSGMVKPLRFHMLSLLNNLLEAQTSFIPQILASWIICRCDWNQHALFIL